MDTVFWRQVESEWVKEADVEFRDQESLRKEVDKNKDTIDSMMDFRI